MSIFVERYLGWVLAPLVVVIGLLIHAAGGSFWLTAMPIFLAVTLIISLVETTWHFLLVLQLNELGYTVKKSGSVDWWVNKPGHGIGPGSLTDALGYAKEYERERQVREIEKGEADRQLKQQTEQRELLWPAKG